MKRWIIFLGVLALSVCSKASAVCNTGSNPTHNAIPGLQYFSNGTPYQSNPLTNSDPRLLKASKYADYQYYMYYPHGHDVVAFASNDMLQWCLVSNSVLHTPSYGAFCPGVFFIDINGKPEYYLYYVKTATDKSIGVATGTTPLGDLQPDGSYSFTQQADMFDGQHQGSGTTAYQDIYIDPTVIKDSYTDANGNAAGSGNVYMYYKHNRVNTYDGSVRNQWLMEVQLNPSTNNPAGLPWVTHMSTTNIMLQLYTSSHNVGDGSPTNYQSWEQNTIEHPVLFISPDAQSAHRYYLLYNGADWTASNYAVGYATAAHPDGPFTRASTSVNPILAATNIICSPGSPNPIDDTTSTRWLIYRQIPAGAGSSACNDPSNRRTSMDVLNRNTSTDVLSITPTLDTTWPNQPNF